MLGFLRKQKIKHKIIFALLGVSMISLIAFSGVFYFGMASIKTFSTNSSIYLGSQAAANSRQALEDLATKNMLEITGARSDIINQKLLEHINYIKIVSNTINGFYKNPHMFSPVEIPPTDPANKGILALQYSAGEFVKYEDVKEEIQLLANIYRTFDGIMNVNSNIVTMYVGTKSGVCLAYDRNSDVYIPVFDPRTRNWYAKASSYNKPVFVETYDDAYGRGLVISAAAPFYNGNGERMGVCGMDILLADVETEILSSTMGENGYMLLIDEFGNLISSSNEQAFPNAQFGSTDLKAHSNKDFARLISGFLEGSNDTAQKINFNDEQVYISHRRLPSTNWTLCSVLPVSEIVAPALQNHSVIMQITDTITKKIENKIFQNILILVFVSIGIAVIASFLSSYLSKKLSEPIAELTNGVHKLSGGDLEFTLDIKTGDEIEDLSAAFNEMTSKLNYYIENLTKITADKERIATELNVAKKIQSSMLPCIFPAFPERDEFDIYAYMLPAKEVGGDFYDFFLVGEDKLAVVISDVSGKGVAAALFMVITKTLIKNYALSGLSVSEIFEKTNKQLCENNDADMFVTSFMGIMDIKTGDFRYVNAGHNPPAIKTGDKFQWLETSPCFVLAGMDSIKYSENEIRLKKGDLLYLYTDGVTEAANCDFELFSDKRLLEVLNDTLAKNMDISASIKYIKSKIDEFALDCEQADDITMLMLEVR